MTRRYVPVTAECEPWYDCLLGMRDLLLYARLGDEDPGREILGDLLALADRELYVRAPFFTRLLAHRRHRDPELRAAVIAALSGAQGYDGVRAVVAALDDDLVEVRAAATRALIETAKSGPYRLVHALFHPQPDVRRFVLAEAEWLPGTAAVHLLADPDAQDVVEARAALLLVDGDAIGLALDLCDAGIVDEGRLRGVLRRVEWRARVATILSRLPVEGTTRCSTAETEDELKEVLGAAVADRFERVIELLVDDDTFLEQIAAAVKARALDNARGARLARCLARVMFRAKTWSAAALRIAAVWLPAVLARPDVPLDLRKRAATGLGSLSPPEIFVDLVSRWFTSPLCRIASGIDLGVVVGLLDLSKAPPIEVIASNGTVEEWADAIRGDPEHGVPLLAQPPAAAHTMKFRLLVAALLLRPRECADLVLDLVATVANVRSELHPLEEAARRDTTLTPLLLERATERDRARTLTMRPRQRQRLVSWLGEALTDAQVDALALTLARRPPDGGDWIDGEVLSAALRARPPDDAAARVAALSSKKQIAFLEWASTAGHFPAAAFIAIVARLAESDDARVAETAARLGRPMARGDDAFRASGDARPLTTNEAALIREVDDDDLPDALRVVFEHAVHGVADALLARASPASSEEACVAALFAFDDPVLACRAFERYAAPDLLERVDGEMVERGRRAENAPLLAACWLHRWEMPLSSLERDVMARPKRVLGLLRDAMDWPSVILVDQAWRAAARLAAVWRTRRPDHFRDVFDEDTGRFVASRIHVHGAPAAHILIDMYKGGVAPELMQTLMGIVLERLDRTDEATRDVLARWFDTGGQGTFPEDGAVAEASETELEEAQRTDDAVRLAELALRGDPIVAHAALARLSSDEVEGAFDALAAAVAGGAPVPHRAWVAKTLDALASSGPHAHRLDLLVGDDAVCPPLRFELAMRKMGRDGVSAWPSVARAIVADTPLRWLDAKDLDRVREAGIDENLLALDTVTSGQYPAYTSAVRFLVEQPLSSARRAALRAFLEVGDGRLGAVRLSAARKLWDAGDAGVLPIVASAAIERWIRQDSTPVPPPFLSRAPGVAEELATSVGAALPGLAPALLYEIDSLAREDRAAPILAVLQQAETKAVQQRALAALPRSGTTLAKIHRLAQIFAWGARESRLLLGSAYRVHLIGGSAYGYTRLEQRSIFVNPMSFLRGERDGEDVLRGLILHELGHHVYHADPAALEIWRGAERAKRHGLLNLVADEHLERNLRAGHTAHGDHLKVLAAHAFQHARRSVDVETLIALLRARTFDVLVATKLEVARERTHVRVDLGAVFQELERRGSSFVRFVRALRMGLGDRHDDAKVREALALFKGARFRTSSMAELWAITQKVAEIFADEAALIDLMDVHATEAGESVDDGLDADGIDDESVQREVDRILDGSAKKKKPDGSRTINRGESERFDEIRDVQRVLRDPATHREAVARVVRAARRLREILMRLGLQLEPRRARLRGRTLDRSRLGAVLLRRDPRMLVAREPVQRSDLFLGVLIDCSGSMSLNQNLEKAKLFGVLLAEAARGLRGVDARFFGFSDTAIFDAGTADQCHVSGLELQGGNNDAAALWHAAQVGMKSRRRAKVLVMISDGSPTECTVASLRSLVRHLERKRGFLCAQVAVRPIADDCFTNYIELLDDDLDSAVRRFGLVVSRLVRTALSAA